MLIHSLGEGSSDNYAYLVVDDKSKDAVIIDPANPDECVSRYMWARENAD
jgi:glyoxylase-like metal-dependent hydrolase (beta-lactamase superfamily II)